jgi:hypothetical protein
MKLQIRGERARRPRRVLIAHVHAEPKQRFLFRGGSRIAASRVPVARTRAEFEVDICIDRQRCVYYLCLTLANAANESFIMSKTEV